jgi:hypothetical protein
MEILSLIREFVVTPPRTEYGKEPEDQPKPVSPGTIVAVETQLGFKLPITLSRIYTEIANGDVGPGYGIFPVHDEPEMNDLVDMFRYCIEGNGQVPNCRLHRTGVGFTSALIARCLCIQSLSTTPITLMIPVSTLLWRLSPQQLTTDYSRGLQAKILLLRPSYDSGP